MSPTPSRAAKAGSPDCLAWPRGTARAFTVLPPDPVRRGDVGFGGRTSEAGIDLSMEVMAKRATRRGLWAEYDLTALSPAPKRDQCASWAAGARVLGAQRG